MTHTNHEKFVILLVDDREENLTSLEELLQNGKRVFLKARSGNDALKLALKHGNIGLIMLDVQMPGMDGFEVAQLLKSNARTKDIAILFVTAINTDQSNVLRGFDSGAVDYLQKPLNVSVTKAKVAVFEKLYFYQEELRVALEEKNKINAQLERFMYVVAHDLKSPLSGVVGLLQIMRDDERIIADDQLKEYMKLMLDASTHLTDMIGSILEYSRQGNGGTAVEEVDVQTIVQELAHLLFPPGHIHITIQGPLPVMRTQKFKLQQVFQNLMSNAIKYIDKPEGEIQISFADKGDFYRFYVRDNGPGIGDRDKDRIFRLFETTDNKASREGSTGVGLNILKVLVEEQGGTIGVDSLEGVGSTFYFDWRK